MGGVQRARALERTVAPDARPQTHFCGTPPCVTPPLDDSEFEIPENSADITNTSLSEAQNKYLNGSLYCADGMLGNYFLCTSSAGRPLHSLAAQRQHCTKLSVLKAYDVNAVLELNCKNGINLPYLEDRNLLKLRSLDSGPCPYFKSKLSKINGGDLTSIAGAPNLGYSSWGALAEACHGVLAPLL